MRVTRLGLISAVVLALLLELTSGFSHRRPEPTANQFVGHGK